MLGAILASVVSLNLFKLFRRPDYNPLFAGVAVVILADSEGTPPTFHRSSAI